MALRIAAKGASSASKPAGPRLFPSTLRCTPAGQVEIYFSVVQRKVLTPNDFRSLAQLEDDLLSFQERYEKSAAPFQWTFTRKDLDEP